MMQDLNLVDEEGNDLNLSILEMFPYKDQHYAILTGPVDSGEGIQVYVLKMEIVGEQTTFVIPDEDVIEEVIQEASKIINQSNTFGCGSGGCSGNCSSCGQH